MGTTHQNAEEVTENVRTVHVRAHRHQLAHQVLHEQVDDCAQRLQRILVGTLLQCVLRSVRYLFACCSAVCITWEAYVWINM